MEHHILDAKPNLLRMFVDVANLVLRDWDYLAGSDAGYVDLQLESGDDIRINPDYGICDWVERYLSEEDMSRVYGAWEHYSGSDMYPVGGEAEYHHSGVDNKYRSQDRRALCEWVRDCAVSALECMENDDE